MQIKCIIHSLNIHKDLDLKFVHKIKTKYYNLNNLKKNTCLTKKKYINPVKQK